MTKPPAILTAVLAGLLVCGAAFAQSATTITDRDVIGEWRLLITPAEGQGRNITFRGRDGTQRLDFPLAITSPSNGRLGCVVSDEPAECRIRRGQLRIVSAGDGVTMIYTLRARARDGFTGVADLRVRGLPIGGQIGSVTMVRR